MKIVLRGGGKKIVLRQTGRRGPQGEQGPVGPQGPQGEQGIQGEPGEGLPTGGTTGQVPVKQSAADYDIAWETPPAAPVDSVNGQTGAVVLDAQNIPYTTGQPNSINDVIVALGNNVQDALDTKADQSALEDHIDDTNNPHEVTKAQVGLGNADNTSDADKPISTATQAALNLKLDASRMLQGTGFPNGVVSAPVGTIYVDTAVTNGASSWIKKSGTGNTGWAVLEGDTGWRNVSSLVDTTLFRTNERLYAQVRRVNNTVEMMVDVYPIETSSSGEVQIFSNLAPLSGFRMNGGTWERVALVNVSGNAMIGYSKPGDNYKLFWTDGGNIRARYVATTNQPWPTTLPGTPA